MAKVIIKRRSNISALRLNHDVFLNNNYLGILKNGGVLHFEADVGSYMLYFKSRSKIGQKNADFFLVINNKTEVVELETFFDYSGKYVIKYADNLPHLPNYDFGDGGGLRCPNCGNTDLTTVSETATSGKDFKTSDACCGYLLCGPIGLLLGTAGKGKQQYTNSFWVCKKCGNKFKM